ncbi:MAG: class II fumarate hydratase [Alphaproteobacteria bacterium]|uniref:Fumarate hydratase class II n=1 Tax=Candidatus Nitrobium versatile TaxID=2884831 RepID=A0A953LZY7_9BACT|nr:class II fumarate hydratase [Candidatus Nitrobium versatile]
MPDEFRIERDSIGEVRVPAEAYWGAQSQRAIENFSVSDLRFPSVFIHSLALIKYAAAIVNADLGLLEAGLSSAIVRACSEIMEEKHANQFPLGIYQTGSGTSTNMNVNEVAATRANEILTGKKSTTSPVHPNDHVNKGQSSNDVIPSCIRIAAYREARDRLLPSLRHLHETVVRKQHEYKEVVKTGRTHLMDAVPVTFGQEMSGWATQLLLGIERIEGVLPRLAKLPLGGTAVGTGVNTHPEFGDRVIRRIGEITGFPFVRTENPFEAQASMDIAAELSGQLKTVAVGLMKIANDMRLMNSGPYAGLAEILLPALQPGSSIMPGKVNPVIPEAVRMVCARVMGNDTTITVSCLSGELELNTMLPVIGYSLLESVEILSSVARIFADKAVAGMRVNTERIRAQLDRNPLIATALAPVLGYEKTAEIVKKAIAEDRRIRDVVLDTGLLSEKEIDALLDVRKMV